MPTTSDTSLDEQREAFTRATTGDWRIWPDYVNRILDDALELMAPHRATPDAPR
jgi:hypothetical protein